MVYKMRIDQLALMINQAVHWKPENVAPAEM